MQSRGKMHGGNVDMVISWSMKINECTVLGKGCRICEQEYVSEGYKVVCKIKEVENNTRVILCDLLNKRKL